MLLILRYIQTIIYTRRCPRNKAGMSRLKVSAASEVHKVADRGLDFYIPRERPCRDSRPRLSGRAQLDGCAHEICPAWPGRTADGGGPYMYVGWHSARQLFTMARDDP